MPILPPKLTLGKTLDNDLSLPGDKTVSRRHCAIHVEQGELFIEDLKSSNGTYVNGTRIQGKAPISTGSLVIVGRTRLTVVPHSEGADEEEVLDSGMTRKGSVIIPSTSAFTELTRAYFVVDVIRSTQIMKNRGETYLLKLIVTIGRILDNLLINEEDAFLKNTGDGFFGMIGSRQRALDLARELLPRVHSLYGEDVSLSIALHWGTARNGAEEGPMGNQIHALFSLEELRREQPEIRSIVETLGNHCLVLMTESFRGGLDEDDGRETVLLGRYLLKGLNDYEAVYRWVGSFRFEATSGNQAR